MERERLFWIAVRRALLILADAIAERWEISKDRKTTA